MKNVIIYGPTAIGKSDIAVELAKKINAEIISCDSMQIYKDIDIGSAKITQEEMQGIKHHLINIKSSDETYSVFEFVEDCKNAINDIKSRGKNVIIVGGTGLYLKALTENYNYANTNKDNLLREKLEKMSNEELVEILKKYDKQIKQDDLNNRHRLIRYVEIAKNGYVPTKNKFDDSYIMFGLCSPREILYDRINKRVDKMVEIGLIDEAKKLLAKLDENSQSLKAIGYKELLPFINKEKSLNECTDVLKQKTRNYAKRQITFMNQFKSIIKINVTTKQKAVEDIFNVLKEER